MSSNVETADGVLVEANSGIGVIGAGVIGTTIEYFDFFAYGTAAVLYFPKLFFPSGDSSLALLGSLLTFSIAFFARPFGGFVFGHFGDRIGRKATLVASLVTMGFATGAIGLLPTYASIGFTAPLLLTVARLGQGIGLGGEWSGAVLLAAENAPKGRRGLYAAMPQFGAPLGFLLSTAAFYFLKLALSDADFLAWGWRVPFLLSFVLVWIGLYVRLNLVETAEFRRVLKSRSLVPVPLRRVFAQHKRAVLVTALIASLNFVLFYLISVFLLSWGSTKLGYSRETLLGVVIVGICFQISMVAVSGWLADRYGSRRVLMVTTVAIGLFGLVLAPLFESSIEGVAVLYIATLVFHGLNFGALSGAVAAHFPTEVRYTGSATAYNLSAILGGSIVPYIATWLANGFGLEAVGGYLSVSALMAFVALLFADRGIERAGA
jgi:MFS family permease